MRNHGKWGRSPDLMALGILVGFVLGMIVAAILDSRIQELIKDDWVQFVGMVVILLAAYSAWHGVQQQIHQQHQINQDTRHQELNASRALLPLALTQVLAITDEAIRFSLEADEFYANSENYATVRDAIQLPAETLTVLQNCIRYSDQETNRWISAGIARYQIAGSRILGRIGVPNLVISDRNKAQSAADWCVVAALFSHLFPFARGSEIRVSERLDVNEIRVPIHFFPLDGAISEEISGIIAVMRDRSESGLIEHFEISNDRFGL